MTESTVVQDLGELMESQGNRTVTSPYDVVFTSNTELLVSFPGLNEVWQVNYDGTQGSIFASMTGYEGCGEPRSLTVLR